ncbi:MAG TPA: 50S ribosomal protein L21 [Candidatus Woesebacteria bacterium]|nr:50S ribosomal protein L21 [Candidatus Woesebacteria bacterium]
MQKHAVILVGGKQFLVQEGDQLLVENLNKEPKDTLDMPILMSFNETNEVELGAPELANKATIEVVENVKGDKVRVAKFKSKVRYRKVRGFRPQLTKIKIVKI